MCHAVLTVIIVLCSDLERHGDNTPPCLTPLVKRNCVEEECCSEYQYTNMFAIRTEQIYV